MSSDTVLPGPRAVRPRIAAAAAGFVLAATCATCATQWGLRVWRGAHAPGVATTPAPDWQALATDAARLYPAPRATTAAPLRYRLWGVIGGGTRAGAALIGVDGRAPQAFATGALVADGVRLVDTRFGEAVLLHDGTREVLPARPAAAPPSADGQAALPAIPGNLQEWPVDGRSVTLGDDAPGGARQPD